MAVGVTNEVRSWKRKESRVVRPFVDAADYLQSTQLRLSPTASFTSHEVVTTDDVALDTIEPILRVEGPPSDFVDRVGFDLTHLALIVIVEDIFLKESLILTRCPLSELKSVQEFNLNPEATRHLSWGHRVAIHVAVVLVEQHPARPGFASRKGSWLARKSFSVGPSTRSARFPLEYVEDEWFTKRNLPANTMYFVQIAGDLDLMAEEEESPVTVYISKSLANALKRDETSSVNLALIRQMFSNIIVTVLQQGFSDRKSPPSPGSFLDDLVQKVAKDAGISEDSIVDIAIRGDWGALSAYAQAACDLRRHAIAACGR